MEMNENSRFLEDLEMLRSEQVVVGDTSIDDEERRADELEQEEVGFGSFKFGSNNPLEQLGLYMKMDEDEEEDTAAEADVEEGEID